MAFSASNSNISSQLANDAMSWNSQYNMTRMNKNESLPAAARKVNAGGMQMPLPPQRSRKTGIFGEDNDDNETSLYFNQTMFRPDREMMTSQSPSSQLSSTGGGGGGGGGGGFSGNFYNPALPLQQRAIGGGGFPRNTSGHMTPTSLNPNFPIGMPQQQHSPNSAITAIGPRSVLGQNAAKQPMNNLRLPNISLPSNYGSTGGHGLQSLNSFGLQGRPENVYLSDLSEFPSLSNRNSIPSNPMPPPRNYGMISKPVQEAAPEFNITQEEFPALPGSQIASTSSTGELSNKSQLPTTGLYDQLTGKGDTNKFLGEKTQPSQIPKRGIQTHPDGTISNIPPGMVTDQFGIVGLLSFIRAAETNQHLVPALIPGIDLTTLGLNLNSPENLYSTFQSPWAEAPCRPQDIDFHVPAEYITNIFIREKLAPIKLNRYGEDLLFFLFYMSGGDVLQLAAAAELHTRDWRYHKEERTWMTRAPGMEPVVKTNTYERGTYYFFDAQKWRKVAREFHLEYDKLEERPSLPPTLHHNPNNPNQPIVAH
ncbi:hypothetical protein SNE40_005368 [Patella caerulea]|uniref:CCR4-NOT transcription complex subunit 2 n=1 Tax=Patella caerulea TaxID=87958 RepID=A0AAN8JWV2_PATCE